MERLCFDEELFADYLEGRLSDEDRSEIELHFSHCDQCLERVAVTGRIVKSSRPGIGSVETAPVPERVTRAAVRMITAGKPKLYDAVKVKINRSVRNITNWILNLLMPGSLGEPHLMPIRGSKQFMSKDLVHVRKTFKEIDTEIEIENAGNHHGHIRVHLIGNSKNRGNVRVTLKRGDREIASFPLTKDYAVFEDVSFGHYSLLFIMDRVIIGKYLFEIKET